MDALASVAVAISELVNKKLAHLAPDQDTVDNLELRPLDNAVDTLERTPEAPPRCCRVTSLASRRAACAAARRNSVRPVVLRRVLRGLDLTRSTCRSRASRRWPRGEARLRS